MSWEDRFDKVMEGLDRTMEGLDKRLDRTFESMDNKFEKFHRKIDNFTGTIKSGKGSKIIVNGWDVTDKFREMEKKWDAEKNGEEQLNQFSNVVDAKEDFGMLKRSRLVTYYRMILAIIIMIIFIAMGSLFYSSLKQKKYEPKQIDKTPAPIEQPVQTDMQKKL